MVTPKPILEALQTTTLDDGMAESDVDEGMSGGREIAGSSLQMAEMGEEVSEKELRDLTKPKPEGKGKGKGMRRGRRDLDPAMDCLINAHLCPTFHCRRKVFNIHFDDTSSGEFIITCLLLVHFTSHSPTGVDHRASVCDPSGCQRCAPIPSSLCCDIHHPDYLTLDAIATVPRPRVPARSRRTKFTMGPKEFELSEALEDWREQKMRNIHGEAHLIDLGPAAIMPDGVLDRIVECAHTSKIKTVDDLFRETRWAWNKTNQFGTEVVTIIHRILPLPVVMSTLTTTPRLVREPATCPTVTSPVSLPHVSTALPLFDIAIPCSSSSVVVTKKNKCSACGMEGHNSTCR